MVTASILRIREILLGSSDHQHSEGGERLILFQEMKYIIFEFPSDIHFFSYKHTGCQLKNKKQEDSP